MTTHGCARASGFTRAYKTWRSMRQRCQDANCGSYYKYGGRGISVCDRWQKYENFLSDMGEPPSDAHSIDRIDNDRGYEPGNCRWATRLEQANNTRANVRITVGEVTKTVTEWSRIAGIAEPKLRKRLLVGYSPEESLSPEDFRALPRGPRVVRPENVWIECACGCGGSLLRFDSRWRPRSTIHGHNRRVVCKMMER
jgi:hypothetical protein